MIGGRLILDGGRVLTVDEARVRGAAEKAIARLLEANAASLAFARSLENAVGDFSIARGREVHGLGACCRQRTASVPRGPRPRRIAVTLDRFVVAFPVGFPYTWRRLASESDGRAP